MKKKLQQTVFSKAITALLLLAFMPRTYAQIQDVLWAKHNGGPNQDVNIAIATDPSGNVYTTGYFTGTSTFGSSTFTSSGPQDVYVTKTDAAGNPVWAKQFGGSSSDFASGITCDAFGNTYITGYFTGSCVFGSTTLISGSYNIFVVKLNAAGSVIWAKKWGDASYQAYCNSLTTDPAGNLYATGFFINYAIFDSFSLYTSKYGNKEIFVLKADSAGTVTWAQRFGGSPDSRGNGIALDPSGNIYTAGYFRDTVTCGVTTLMAAGNNDIFLARMSNSGTVMWAKQFGGSGNDQATGLASDAVGYVYTVGDFAATAAFGSSSFIADGGQDAFLLKTNGPGSVITAKQFGGPFGDIALGVAADNDLNAYVTGIFSGTAAFGPTTLTATGGGDVFVTKMDASNNIAWGKRCGGPNNDQGTAISIDDNSNVCVSGLFSNTATFDSYSLASYGTYDEFVFKIAACATFDTAVTVSGNVLTASQAGVAYQWLDCNNGYAPVSGAFGQLYTATSNGSYAVRLFSGSCADTSACITVNSVGIDEPETGIIASLYPNPAHDQLTLEVKTPGQNTIAELYDVTGRMICAVQLKDTKTQLEIATLNPGIYVLKLRNEKGVETKRFVKE